MHIALQVLCWIIVGHGGLAVLLTLMPRLGSAWLAAAVARAPMLDLFVALLTWVPWVVGAYFAGWLGVAASIGAQAVVLALWTTGHELMHPRARKGPRIVKSLNKIVGRAPNHLALWATLPALPAFWMIRFAQVFAYPLLRVILNFPKYKHSEWVMVSRHKFDGLVGHDLIWCLYCDWMTGVYSLGGEMLRNVESFWCPIRFYDGKKCENCKVDFPDIDGGWVNADGTMEDVVKVVEEKYASGRREWFGHPVRLTVKGESGQKRE
ncbi:MAG: hypothetical protein SFY96_09845 [Planctomycetota bacterium]|nr:hypothetical protein [Planctomycetota bacterium]